MVASTDDSTKGNDPASPAAADSRTEARDEARAQIGRYLRKLVAALGLLPDEFPDPTTFMEQPPAIRVAVVEQLLVFLYEGGDHGRQPERAKRPADLPATTRAVTNWFTGQAVPNKGDVQTAFFALAADLAAQLAKQRGTSIPEPNGSLAATLTKATRRQRNPRRTPAAASTALGVRTPTDSDHATADEGGIPTSRQMEGKGLAGLAFELDPTGAPSRWDDLNPYRLGATESDYGDRTRHGSTDPYVARTVKDMDGRIQHAAAPGKLLILVGPSKAGKTRTLYENLRIAWPDARILIPCPGRLKDLINSPDLQRVTGPLVVWLDDLHSYLTGRSSRSHNSC